jgi:hypothetical protein
MVKKGDVAFIADDDDDEMRISVSRKQVTVTLFTVEFFLRTQYI